MAISWKVDNAEVVYIEEEGSNINHVIVYEHYNSDEKVIVNTSVLSTTLPSSISVEHDKSASLFKISGNLPLVDKDTTYNLILRLSEIKDNDIIDIKDICVNIINKDKKLGWKSSENTIVQDIIEYTDVNINLMDLLENTNGNEEIVKISGEMPQGLILNKSGLIYGAFMQESGDKNTYDIDVKVYRNGKPIEVLDDEGNITYLTKTIRFEIYPPRVDENPVWITQEGKLGSLNYGEESHLSVFAYDPSGNYTIKYAIIDGVLPLGLSFDVNNGKISGVLQSQQQTVWKITIRAIKMLGENGTEYMADRTFTISTNNISSYNEITWNTTNFHLGDYKIGEYITKDIPTAISNDGEQITYRVIGGELPKGLVLSKNGILSGQPKYQEQKTYTFDICAETSITYNIHSFTMSINKGLGRNALNLYLRFNNEYKAQLNSVRKELNGQVYNNGSVNFEIDSMPKIDVATLTCYDREVLAHMLNFGNPEIVRLGNTRKIQHSQPNDNGTIISNYDVFYKAIDESTLQWDKINNGNYDFQSKIDEMNEGILDGNIEKIDFNLEKYDSNKDTLFTYSEETDSENEEKYVSIDYSTDPHVQYDVFNFENVRKILSQRLYVYQNEGYYFYDRGNHKILGKTSGVNDEMFNPDYNGMNVKKDSYGKLVVEGATVIEDENGNLLLKSEFENGETIYNPWCYDRKNEKNLLTITNIEPEFEMVLPLINDDDVKYDEYGKAYIQFLDVENEPLPEWKVEDPKTWKPNTQYYKNDIIKYNYQHYRCKQDFISTDTFVVDENLYELLTAVNISSCLKKKYFPTFNIGYYDVDTNTTSLKQLNALENQGKFLTNYDFVFYELTGEHLYKEDIQNEGDLVKQEYNIYKQEDIKNHDSILGIPFTSLQYPEYEHSPLMKTMIINTTPSDATISINPLSGEETNKTTLPYGTFVSYSITKPKYYGISDAFKLLMDEEIDITLKKKVRFILLPEPISAEVELKTSSDDQCYDYDDGSKVGKYIDVKEGDRVYYKVSMNGYLTNEGSIIAVGNTEKDDYYEQWLNISLTPIYTLTIVPTPSDATVKLTYEGYNQVGNSISVPKDSYVHYEVSKVGYTSITGNFRVIQNTTYPISLDDNVYTVTITPKLIPSTNSGSTRSTVTLQSNKAIGTQQSNSLMVEGDSNVKTYVDYTVSCPGYETVSGRLNGVKSNIEEEVSIRAKYRIEFIVIPSDAKHIIEYVDANGNNIRDEHNLVFNGLLYNDVISYTFTRPGYTTYDGRHVIKQDEIITINMNDMNYFVLETDDSEVFYKEGTSSSLYAFVKE